LNFFTFADAVLPFLPSSIFVYFLIFLVPPAAIIVLRKSTVLKRFLWLQVAMIIICIGAFIFLPMRVPRPGIPTQENFIYWLVALLYTLDRPIFAFPGMWFALSLNASLVLIRYRHRAAIAFLSATFVASIASMMLKQHVLADLVAGGLLSAAAYFFLLRKHIQPTNEPMNIKKLLPVAYIFLAALLLAYILFESGLRFEPVLPVN